MKTKIDFYKKYKLVPPVCGLVNKITSPKGKKTEHPDGYTHYSLHSELSDIYHGEAVELESGLYWVMDVCKVMGRMTWNHYLFIISDDGNVFPIAEYLEQRDTAWVKKAIKIVKTYFNDGEDAFEPIEVTKIKYKSTDGSHWKGMPKA